MAYLVMCLLLNRPTRGVTTEEAEAWLHHDESVASDELYAEESGHVSTSRFAIYG
jgi:hypothetical protein